MTRPTGTKWGSGTSAHCLASIFEGMDNVFGEFAECNVVWTTDQDFWADNSEDFFPKDRSKWYLRRTATHWTERAACVAMCMNIAR